MKAVEIIKKNYYGENDTFIYFLHEKKRFDETAFWSCYNSIRQVCLCKDELSNKEEMDQMIFKIYSFFSLSILWHAMPQDTSVISGIEEMLVSEYLERMTLLINESYFGHRMIDEKLLNEAIINPERGVL